MPEEERFTWSLEGLTDDQLAELCEATSSTLTADSLIRRSQFSGSSDSLKRAMLWLAKHPGSGIRFKDTTWETVDPRIKQLKAGSDATGAVLGMGSEQLGTICHATGVEMLILGDNQYMVGGNRDAVRQTLHDALSQGALKVIPLQGT